MSRSAQWILIVLALALAAPAARAVLDGDDEIPNALVVSTHEFDALNRVTDVARGNGHSIEYVHDPAGNIVEVGAIGRASAVLAGTILPWAGGGDDDDDFDGDDDAGFGGPYEFDATAGEPITLRLEAVPREAGVGKFARLRAGGKTITSSLPVELTLVATETDEIRVHVKRPQGQTAHAHRYLGPYTLTLEASDAACASFGTIPPNDDD